MKIISLVALMSALLMSLRVTAFELAWAVLLGAPVMAFFLGQFFTPSAGLNIFCLLLLLGAIVAATLPGWRARVRASVPEALYVSLAGALFISFCASQWPDFISMGERLRDYALLGSVVASPVVPREPWLAGTELNYYLYWYRFGAFYGSIVGLPVWELYHALQALTGALFLGATFQLFRVYAGARFLYAFGAAIFLSFGSNIQGIVNFVTHDNNWWGPSRVIPGAINEFPVWSLLLGDLHPHYLNLGLVPFGVILALRFSGRPLLQGVLAVTGLFWVYAANAWEIPATLILLAIGCAWLFKCRGPRALWHDFSKDLRQKQGTLALIVLLFLGGTLYLSARHIVPAHAPLRFVGAEIAASPLGSFMLHWGLPVGLAAGALLRLLWLQKVRLVPVGALIIALFTAHPIPLLSVLFGLSLWHLLRVKDEPASPRALAHLLFLSGIAIVAVPELVFFDDPYGGENERMNTVFKFYSAAWWPLHCGALLLVLEAVRGAPLLLRRGLALGGLCGLVLFLGFFYQTYSLRQTPKPRTPAGLTSLETQFPGSATIVSLLRTLPRSVLLEAEGGAYDYTAHIATLGGMESFLGWANHVNLLSRNYAEVSRREELIRGFYQKYSCPERRDLLTQEKIQYAIVGPLERQRYEGMKTAPDFSCLKLVERAGAYELYE